MNGDDDAQKFLDMTEDEFLAELESSRRQEQERG